tara:strand:+ start:2151 stop:2906 length:756 start_codon:yes stop_codon:yes gene_type:complete
MSNSTFSNTGYNNYVMLELARRASGDTTGSSFTTNRIGLLANTLDISTNKQTLAFPVPFSGIVSGESKTIGIDLGLATKTITISGIILDQYIVKDNSRTPINVKMSAHEIAQLIHSYVDSSFLHEDQNLSKLIILMPSRVDENFVQRTGHIDTDHSGLPLIPFNWANRDYDIPQTSSGFKLSLGATEFPSSLNSVIALDNDNDIETEIPGIPGFINDFSTSFAGDTAPAISFSLSFTNASTAASDFINEAF